MGNLPMSDARRSYGAVEITKSIDLGIRDRAFGVFVDPSG